MLRGLVGRLVVVTGLALLPALGVQAWAEFEASRARQAAVREDALRLVRLVASQQQQTVEGARQMLTALGNLSAVRAPNPAMCSAYLASLLEGFPRYVSAASIGLDGRVICSSRPAGAGLHLSDRAYFRRALDAQGFAVGDHVIGRGSGRPSVHFAQPYRDLSGQVAGVVTLALDLGWLQARLDELPLPPGAAVVVTDQAGTVLARRPDPERFVGRQVPPLALRVLQEGAFGVQEATGLDGVVRIVGYAPFGAEPRDLGIAVGLERSPGLGGLLDADRRGLLLLALSLALALLVTLVVGGPLVRRPVARLLGTAERWRRGDLSARVGARDDGSEFGRLGAAFDAVAAAADARERALRAALESTADSVFVLDPDWRFRFMNRRAREQLTAGRDLTGEVVWEAFPDAVGSAFWHAYRRCMAERVPTEAEEFYAPLGRAFAARAFPNDDGGVSVFFRDVTEERAGASALAAERARRAAFYRAAPVGLALLDRDLRYVEVNERLAAINRLPAEAHVGRALRDVLPEMSVWLEPMIRRVVETGQPVDGVEITGRTPLPTGEPRTWLAGFHPVRDGSTVLGVSAAILEITDRKRVEADLAALTRRLEDRVAEEVAAREEAQARAAHAERLQALGQLAGGIAHDFNNVLQGVGGAAALIERRAGDAESVRRYARLAIEATERGSAITRRLLAFARRGDLRAERIEPVALLRDMREVLQPTLGSTIEVRVSAPARLPALRADRSQLETVLVNLATNARDAMPAGGILTLSAAAESVTEPRHRAGLAPGSYLRLDVADTGLGMDRATLQRAVEPFFSTKSQDRGTGLGLSMAKGFAEQSGGGLALDSTMGGGTTVSVWLPAAGEEAPEPSAPAAPSVAGTAWRLMLVDDEPMVRDTLRAQLTDAGFSVQVVPSAEAALAELRAGLQVDALVTDLSMPGMNGFALIEAARRLRPQLPAVLLTGYAGDAAQLAVSGALTGHFTLLRKPVTAAQLIDRIEALLAGLRREVG